MYLAALAVVGLATTLIFHVLTNGRNAGAFSIAVLPTGVAEPSRSGSVASPAPTTGGAQHGAQHKEAAASAAPINTPTNTTPTSSAAGRAAVAALIAGAPAGGVSVAAYNTSTGASYSAGATSGMWTASAYKLFVLETLLLHDQQQGTTLSDTQVDQATTMIENSDNEAGYDLFLDAGGNAGLSAAAAAFGMTHTQPGRTDPTFTTTSAADYLVLLRNLVTTTGPLSAASRSFILGLMRDVEADQRWGVGAVAEPGTDFANKNGWLSVDNTNGPGEDDDYRWIVTSVGVVTVHGQQLLLAAFSEHQPSMADGVTLVQDLARDVVPVVVS